MDPVRLYDAATGIELSVPTLDDVSAITDACQDFEIQMFTTVPSPYTQEHARGFVTEFVPSDWAKGGPTWAIRFDHNFVGMIGLSAPSEPGVADIGYWIAPDFRGRGALHNAIGMVLDFGFETLRLRKVTWQAVIGNWGSWKAVWRYGFRREGIAREAHAPKAEGEPYLDVWTGSLLAADPRLPAEPWDGPERGTPPIPDPRDPEALVRQFHATYNLPVMTSAANVDVERVHMRMSLIAEEFAELMGAIYGEAAENAIDEAVRHAVALDDGTRDTVGAADALADMIYVIYGMALETGIPLDAVLREVQRSNMSKLGSDGKPIYREDGKVLKGPGFFDPAIEKVLSSTHLLA